MSTLQPKTNRCNSDFYFIKKAYDISETDGESKRNIIKGKQNPQKDM